MKGILTALMLLFFNHSAMAFIDMMPDSPLDSSMGEAASDTVGTVNQLENEDADRGSTRQRQEEEAEEETDYTEPSDEEFNRNWNEENL